MKKEVNIKVTIINIALVISILLFLGSINLLVSQGRNSTVLWLGSLSFLGIIITILMRVFVHRHAQHSENKQDLNSNRALLKEILSDGVIDEEELNQIKEMKIGK